MISCSLADWYHSRMDSRDTATAKASQLQADLRGLGRVLVAYSGGVDSAYLPGLRIAS